MEETNKEQKYFNERLLSNIIREKANKNCYSEEVDYSILLEAISEKLENLKGFVNGSCIHELINIQCIISNQLNRRKKENGM
ncbi:MAG: hypothetical protein A3J81_06105 [Nitrospirae bacterium RIFOXYB2_FULL_43_5]|nr:MAG: hypothetical protein A3J81_06105 [Nitrospirae bacterium RIFOXYB2_FULL_43_5]